MSTHSTDPRWKDEHGIVHTLIQTQKEVFSGRGTRWVQRLTSICGNHSFPMSQAPRLVDEATSCVACIADVDS